MREYKVVAHTRYYIKYHIVWIVKYRKPLLTDEKVVQQLVSILEKIGKDYEIPAQEIGVDEDHLHLFCRGIPDIKPARIVEIYKSISARELRKIFPNLVRQTSGAGLWGVGNYISTVGHKTNEEAVRNYIKNQGKKKMTYEQLKLIK